MPLSGFRGQMRVKRVTEQLLALKAKAFHNITELRMLLN
jgi:hypothetical protein